MREPGLLGIVIGVMENGEPILLVGKKHEDGNVDLVNSIEGKEAEKILDLLIGPDED